MLKQKRMKKDNQTLGRRLKELRQTAIRNESSDYKKIGFSRDELADILNVSTDTIKNWEQSYSYPDVDQLKAITTLFGCNADYLLGFRDENVRESLRIPDCVLNSLYELPEDHRIIKMLPLLLSDMPLLDNLADVTTHNYEAVSMRWVKPFSDSKEVLTMDKRDMAKVDFVNLIMSVLRFVNTCRDENYLDSLDYLLNHVPILEYYEPGKPRTYEDPLDRKYYGPRKSGKNDGE